RGFALEIFVGTVVLRVRRFCAEFAIQAATGATGREDRAAPLASAGVAKHCDRNSLVCTVCLHRVFGPVLERTNRFVPGHPAFSRLAGPAATAYAGVALPAWFSRVCHECFEPAHFHSWPCLSARCVVLFPRALPFEIAVDVPYAAPSCQRGGLAREEPVTRGAGDPSRQGPGMAQRVGFPGSFRRGLHAEPVGHQHPPFLGCAGAYCLAAGTPAAHAETAAGLEPASGTHRELADNCASGGFHRYGHTCLSELYSLPEQSQHGAAGVYPSQRLESRLEPRSSGS